MTLLQWCKEDIIRGQNGDFSGGDGNDKIIAGTGKDFIKIRVLMLI